MVGKTNRLPISSEEPEGRKPIYDDKEYYTMILDKGRARPNDVPDPMDSLEGMLTKLAEMKSEQRAKKKQYMDDTKDLRESIKSLEAVITEEVKKLHRTVAIGNIRAEYKPQVVIKMKKDKNDGE